MNPLKHIFVLILTLLAGLRAGAVPGNQSLADQETYKYALTESTYEAVDLLSLWASEIVCADIDTIDQYASPCDLIIKGNAVGVPPTSLPAAMLCKLADDLANFPELRKLFDSAENVGGKFVKAWEGLINIPSPRRNVGWLTRSSRWLDEGAEFVTSNGVTKLKKGGQDIFEIKNEKILPSKYDYPVTGGTPVGEASNGYQVVKNGNDLSVRRVTETSGYSQAELDLLTQNKASHVLEKHGHDVTDAALIKRATVEGSPVAGKSYSPDGELGGIPAHSSKFADQQTVKDAIENVKPGSAAYAAKQQASNGLWVVEHPGNFGYGYANGGAGPIPMTKVTAVYKEVTPGNFEMITMYPNK